MKPVRNTTDAVRESNDRHRHWVPLFVLAFLLLVADLWTGTHVCHAVGLDSIEESSLWQAGLSRCGHLSTESWIHFDEALGSHMERQILLALTAIGFLLAYYLPLPYKRKPLVILTFFGIGWVFGIGVAAKLLAFHLFAYATFHRPDPGRRSTRIGMLLCAVLIWVPDDLSELTRSRSIAMALSAAAASWAYRGYHRLLEGRAREWLQGATAHASMLYLAIAFTWNTATGEDSFPSPVGCLLFFWQWERLVMYRIDIRDDRVPPDLSLMGYLATFFTPAFLANVSWLNRVPTGYAYMNGRFLSRDKNRIVLSGVWLIALSVFFFALRPITLQAIDMGTKALGLPTWSDYGPVVRALESGDVVTPLSVWIVLVASFLNFYLLWTAVAHLKVGLWRLFGYDLEPYFQRPLLSVNLVELWRRYSYYYREFLVQAFYYPVFLRFFRRRPYVRTLTATLAAAGAGNLLFHLMEASLYDRANAEVWASILRTTPYYLILGLAIGLTQIWLMRKPRPRRTPWTLDRRLGVDVLCAVSTLGFFILIRPFHHVPIDHSVGSAMKLILAAF